MRLPFGYALAALLLALALAGCVDGDQESVGDTVNNDPTSDSDTSVVDPTGAGKDGAGVSSGEECIHTTSGAKTTGEGDNPCPQGQYPGG